jgi:hypothetical protein
VSSAGAAVPSLAPLTPAMFPELYEALLRDWNPALGEAVWQRAFDPATVGPEGHCGYVLTDGGRIVGVLGMIFSERRIGGRTAPLCNLHSWRVKPAYRARSLALLRPALALEDHTLTDLTPTDAVVAIEKRLGFRTLDRLATVLLPLPRRGRSTGAVVEELTGAAERHRGVLDPAHLRIYQDHQGIDCGHTLVRSGDRSCYLVHSRVGRHWLPHCAVHYVSDPQVFAQEHAVIRRHLARRTGRHVVAVDTRLLDGVHVPGALRVRTTEKLYRSPDLEPDQVDSLYSELALYKHPTLPSLRTQLRRALRDRPPGAPGDRSSRGAFLRRLAGAPAPGAPPGPAPGARAR